MTWGGGGNVGPLSALAAGLVARGHEVAALATPSLCPRLADTGFAPVEASADWLPSADELLTTVDRLRADALVLDYMLPDALCAASAAGLPTVVLVHTLYRALLVDGAPSPMAFARRLDQLNEVRSRLGLQDISGFRELLDDADLTLVSAPEVLDADGPTPPNLIYAGPLLEPARSTARWTLPPGPDPLVVVSLGTAMSGGLEGETSLLRKICEAVSTLSVRAVVNLPGYIEAESLATPANVRMTGYVPHSQLLPRADLLVTHAGLGSICAALAAGVPMVCLPFDRDQPTNAEAVVRIGAGLCLEPECTVEALGSAILEGIAWKTKVQIEPDPALALDAMETALNARSERRE